MLTRLTCRNYRSLEKVDIPLEGLTAIVGPNGAGKTALLRAIDVLAGDAWPNLGRFRIPQDFTNFDTSRSIEITLGLDPPYGFVDALRSTHEVSAIRVSCKPYRKGGKWGNAGDIHADAEPLNKQGEVPMVAVTPPQTGRKPQFRPLNLSGDMRAAARILFVDHRRSLLQHLPSTRGSILGRLLEPVRRDFKKAAEFNDAYRNAMDILRTDAVKGVEAKIEETAKRMLGFMGSTGSGSIQIGFGFADPANPFSSLRLQYTEGGLEIPGEELGLGIQSAMVIGVFEAFRELGGDFKTVVIEEPEMYLHPQAQRYFYGILRDLAEAQECQVIYTTHSPIFADVNRFEAIRLVRKEPGVSSTATYVQTEEERKQLGEYRDLQKISGRFDAARNEVLFARRALLVEGHGDRLAALLVAEKLNLDVDAEGVSIVDCGGKESIPLLASTCAALGIPFVVLHDEDIWALEDATDVPKQTTENDKAEQENQRIAEAVRSAAPIFILRPTLEQCLGISKWARDKPKRVVEAIQAMVVAEVPEALVDAVRTLFASPQEEPGDPETVREAP